METKSNAKLKALFIIPSVVGVILFMIPVKNGHDPLGGLIQILPQAVLQERKLNGVGGLGNANPVTQVADGGGGVAPAAQAAEGGHSGIVPAGDIAASPADSSCLYFIRIQQ